MVKCSLNFSISISVNADKISFLAKILRLSEFQHFGQMQWHRSCAKHLLLRGWEL